MCIKRESFSYEMKLMRDPFLAISSTVEGFPTRTVPWMKMATKPDNMTNIWNTSVQTTAFMPPCYRLWKRRIEKETTADETFTIQHVFINSFPSHCVARLALIVVTLFFKLGKALTIFNLLCLVNTNYIV